MKQITEWIDPDKMIHSSYGKPITRNEVTIVGYEKITGKKWIEKMFKNQSKFRKVVIRKGKMGLSLWG